MSLDLIKDLTKINAVSGYEKPVKDYMLEYMPKGEVITDKLGSFLVKYEFGTGKNVAVIAHMDEVGFLVKSITDEGFIKLINVGGILGHNLVSTKLTVTTRSNKTYDGIVMSSPKMAQANKFEVDDLILDLGFANKEEALNAGLQLGDQVTFDSTFTELFDDKIAAKAFDNRIGCALVCELARAFEGSEIGTLYLGASVQEEVGLRGAQTILANVSDELDNILVVDVSPVDDYENKEIAKVGSGALIRVKDPRMILTPSEVSALTDLAKGKDIQTQHYFSKGGTDAAQLELQKAGHKVAAICLPTRNAHTQHLVISMHDYKAALNLSIEYLKSCLKG